MNKKESLDIFLLRKLSGMATHIIESMWVYLYATTDISFTVFLVGSPRSGTTWLMQIIETLGNYRVVFEPFHRDFYPKVRKIIPTFLDKPIYRPYLSPNYENKNLEDYILKTFQGNISGFWYVPPSRFIKSLKWLKAKKVLVKDIWTTRLLPWIIQRFKIKNYLLLIRHPCAVIESQIRTCIGNPLCYYSSHIIKKAILEQLNTIYELRNVVNRIHPKLENIHKSEELLAAIWSMDYYIPLFYNTKDLYNIVIYEDYILNSSQAIKRMIQLLGLKNKEASEGLSRLIAHRAPTSKDVTDKFINNVYKWKKRLPKYQITSILKIAHLFNLTFYNEDIEPNYNELINWKP